jgi:hypothetical protein
MLCFNCGYTIRLERSIRSKDAYHPKQHHTLLCAQQTVTYTPPRLSHVVIPSYFGSPLVSRSSRHSYSRSNPTQILRQTQPSE